MEILVNFCGDKVQNLNKNISGGKKGGDLRAAERRPAPECAERRAGHGGSPSSSRTAPAAHQGESWVLGVGSGAWGSLCSSIWILKMNLRLIVKMYV